MSEPSPLETHLGYWLRMVSNEVSRSFARRVEQAGATVAEWVVLRKALELGPSAPSQLADALGMTRGAISKLNDRLAEKGLLTIRDSAEDGRRQYVSLTRRAHRVVADIAALADQNDDAFFGVLASEERCQLRTLLTKLAEHHGLVAPPVD